jgi:dolichol-phosphate mannosyltransferase
MPMKLLVRNAELKLPLLSVVIPCYNEEEAIGETLNRLKAFCSDLVNLDVELIFVDDGNP